MTRRHLERRFDTLVGISPKRLARIVRFQRALRMLQRPAGSGADTARRMRLRRSAALHPRVHRAGRLFARRTPAPPRRAERILHKPRRQDIESPTNDDGMKVAAYQAPLLPINSMDAIGLIAEQVRTCESAGAEILCCPEAVLGGLADYSSRPADIAIHVESGRLQAASQADREHNRHDNCRLYSSRRPNGQIFNSAAVFSKGWSGSACIGKCTRPSIDLSMNLGRRLPSSRSTTWSSAS